MPHNAPLNSASGGGVEQIRRRDVAEEAEAANQERMTTLTSTLTGSIREDDVDTLSGGLMGRITLLREMLKVVIGYGQVISSFQNVYQIPWPDSFMWLFSFMSYINIPIFTFPGFACIYKDVEYLQMVTVYFTFPLVMLVYVYAVYREVLMRLTRKLQVRSSHTSARRRPAGVSRERRRPDGSR